MATKNVDVSKQVVRIDSRVEMGLSILPPAQQAAIRKKLKSLELSRTATPRVVGGEKLFVAAVSAQLLVVLRKTAGGVELVDLVNRKAFPALADGAALLGHNRPRPKALRRPEKKKFPHTASLIPKSPNDTTAGAGE